MPSGSEHLALLDYDVDNAINGNAGGSQSGFANLGFEEDEMNYGSLNEDVGNGIPGEIIPTMLAENPSDADKDQNQSKELAIMFCKVVFNHN